MKNRCEICNHMIPSTDANSKAWLMFTVCARNSVSMVNVSFCNKCYDEKVEPALKNLYDAMKLEYDMPRKDEV